MQVRASRLAGGGAARAVARRYSLRPGEADALQWGRRQMLAERMQKMEADAGLEAASNMRLGPAIARHQVRSFALIVGTFIVLLAIALAASWLAIEVVNSTRAYATGEGRYSKAEKIAVLNLHRYAYSRYEGDYAAFLSAVAVPLGDRMARVELERSTPDLAVVSHGLQQGQNHLEDHGGMIRLFRWFSWWRPFAAAVADWREGDRLVEELLQQGARLDATVTDGSLDRVNRAAMLGEIDRIDEELTTRENAFSAHMGEAARAATMLVVVGLSATTVLLWLIGTSFASRLFRRQLALDRQLGSSEQRFRDYADVASDWYWEMDADFGVNYMSERFFAITGAAVENVIGRNAAEFIRDHSDNDRDQEYLAALGEHRPFRGLRLRYARADGTISYWSISGKPVTDVDGRFVGYRGVGSDVTAAASDAQVLREAKNRAEIANRAKSEFLANMSHELRTPLNAILGFADIIRSRLFGADAIDRYAGYAGHIHDSGAHLLSIIDDILDLSKIEAGHAELTQSEVELDSIVRSTRTLFGDRFEQAGIALRFEMPEFALRLLVDERKLKQALVNLLSNSLKFTPRGGSVTLAAAVTADGGMALSVRDTGIGIAADQIETVLAPFGQVESAFSREHHGTGLGLPLAKSLIELHRGSLTLESEPGTGTTVTLFLPASRVVQQPVRESQMSLASA
jgi:PAS domain S-box-containing protein